MRFNRPFFVIGCAAAISSCLLFFFQDEIADIVRSSDICDAHIYDVAQWVFPKVIFRCRLLNDPTFVQVLSRPEHYDYLWPYLDALYCCIFSLFFSVMEIAIHNFEKDLFDYLSYIDGRFGERNRFGDAKLLVCFTRFRPIGYCEYILQIKMQVTSALMACLCFATVAASEALAPIGFCFFLRRSWRWNSPQKGFGAGALLD